MNGTMDGFTDEYSKPLSHRVNEALAIVGMGQYYCTCSTRKDKTSKKLLLSWHKRLPGCDAKYPKIVGVSENVLSRILSAKGISLAKIKTGNKAYAEDKAVTIKTKLSKNMLALEAKRDRAKSPKAKAMYQKRIDVIKAEMRLIKNRFSDDTPKTYSRTSPRKQKLSKEEVKNRFIEMMKDRRAGKTSGKSSASSSSSSTPTATKKRKSSAVSAKAKSKGIKAGKSLPAKAPEPCIEVVVAPTQAPVTTAQKQTRTARVRERVAKSGTTKQRIRKAIVEEIGTKKAENVEIVSVAPASPKRTTFSVNRNGRKVAKGRLKTSSDSRAAIIERYAKKAQPVAAAKADGVDPAIIAALAKFAEAGM